MLQNFMLSAKPWQKYLMGIISFFLLCIATLLFMLCIAAFGITKVDTPEYVLIPLTTVLLTVSSFLDSFCLGKVFKEKGMLIGLSVGFIFSILIVVLSVHFGIFAFSNILYTKLSAVVLAAMCGGILGVN